MRRGAAAVLSMAVTIVACRTRGSPAQTSPSSTGSAAPVAIPAATHDGRSIYALPMTLTDQDGAQVGLDVFRGGPAFIGMFYGTCPNACPMLISTVKRVMSGLDAPTASKLRVLLVSFDPERDSPAALRAVFARHGLDPRWKLASAPEDQVRELAAVLGIQYRRLPDGNFSHTSSILLLDRHGAVDMRCDDLEQDTAPLVARAKQLVR